MARAKVGARQLVLFDNLHLVSAEDRSFGAQRRLQHAHLVVVRVRGRLAVDENNLDRAHHVQGE